MLALGYQPVRLPDADKCDQRYDAGRCYPERQTCAGTGLAPCNFVWRRADRVLFVGTIGELPVVGCRAVPFWLPLSAQARESPAKLGARRKMGPANLIKSVYPGGHGLPTNLNRPWSHSDFNDRSVRPEPLK